MNDIYYDFRVWLGKIFDDLGRGAQAKLERATRITSVQSTRMKNLEPKGPKDTMQIKLDHYKQIVAWARSEYEKQGKPMPPPPEIGAPVARERYEGKDYWEIDYRTGDRDEFSGFTREHYSPKTPGAIPELDLKAGAGEGAVGEVVALPLGGEAISGHKVIDEWLLPDGYLRHQLGVGSKNAIVVEVTGDSMVPTFLPHDKVVVDLRQNQFLGDDGVYLISDGFSPPQIKRLVGVFGSDPREVQIWSDNAAVQPSRTVLLSSIHIIGRIASRLLRF